MENGIVARRVAVKITDGKVERIESDGFLIEGERECMAFLGLESGGETAEQDGDEHATEGYAKELVERMVTLAREGNTAGARGLEKVSGDLIFELNSVQAKLTELGRESVVRAEPVAGQGWHVTLIQVEGREVFNGEEAAQDE